MRKEIIGNATLYCGDCMEGMQEMNDKAFDLAIVDPPYGLERFKKGCSIINKHGGNDREWNNTKPTVEYFGELSRVAKHQIIWGGNNFELPPSEYFVIWQKGNALEFSFAMVEMAWTNIKKPAKLFTHFHAATNDVRIHPTQKPVRLYSWLLANYAKPGQTILDTHLGSGSSVIACLDRGHSVTAYEIDEEYFDAACLRIEQSLQQLKLAL
jgi:site-specific DNA-methyltransferase (adenine-specific)